VACITSIVARGRVPYHYFAEYPQLMLDSTIDKTHHRVLHCLAQDCWATPMFVRMLIECACDRNAGTAFDTDDLPMAPWYVLDAPLRGQFLSLTVPTARVPCSSRCARILVLYQRGRSGANTNEMYRLAPPPTPRQISCVPCALRTSNSEHGRVDGPTTNRI
jgi:hypothetical protein